MKLRGLLFILFSCVFIHAEDITIIGAGYVGLVTSACFSELGNRVTCVDIDAQKIEMLQQGNVPIYEPGLQELITKNMVAGTLFFSNDVQSAVSQADIVFIAVGTPSNDDGTASIHAVEKVAQLIAQQGGNKVIVIKSTVPVGTCKRIRSLIQSKSCHVEVVSNPEFLREGTALYDFMNADRIVIGAENERVAQKIQALYEPLEQKGIPIVTTNLSTAEMVKYVSNSFLAIKLSYINEIADLCEHTHADVHTVAHAVGLDSRIGGKYFKPGPGFGGSCLPKDTAAFMATAKQYGAPLSLIGKAVEINQKQKIRPAQKLCMLLDNSVMGKTIAVLGLAFKADTDDIRYSSSINTINYLMEQGAVVRAYDPVAMKNMQTVLPHAVYCSSKEEALIGADAVIIMTEWQEFKDMDLGAVYSCLKEPVLADARGIINQEALEALGFRYYILGKGFGGI